MKRAEEIAPLSREHHQALRVAQRLARASAADAAELREAFLAFFVAEMVPHFRAEEELVLPAFARHVDPSDPEVVRVLVEHVELHRRAGDLAADDEADPAALHALGRRLHDHVRHEERVLFPRVESALDAEELHRLGFALAQAEREAAEAAAEGAQRLGRSAP
ncbi:MAG: hemerythrin domain-containing protein [Solirubrobacteraceae bacterium]|nr:hemerythrin domain-containing protein [Solirubrobacteraceae bacterium]